MSETTPTTTPYSPLLPPAAAAGLATVFEYSGLTYREALPADPIGLVATLAASFTILMAMALIADGLRALAARIGPLGRWGHRLARSRAGWIVFAVLMLAGIAAWTADLALYVRLYPGYHALLGLEAIGAFVLSIHVAIARQGTLGARRWPVSGSALVVCLAVAHLALAAREDARAAVLGFGVIAADGGWLAAQATDVDRDGAGWLLSGADAHPFDAARGVGGDCLSNVAAPAGDATWAPSAPERPLDVVLITVDALRWDHGPSSPDGARFMPSTARLAERSAVFTAAYAPAAMTMPTVAALHTGRHPWSLDWAATAIGSDERVRTRRIDGWPGPPWVETPALDRHPTLAEGLAAAGYATVGWPPHETLLRPFGLGRGFSTYRSDVVTGHNPNGISVTGGVVVDQAMGFIERHLREAPGTPYFAWVHLFDPHHPYRWPPGTDTTDDGDLARYRAEVLYTDLQIGRLMRALDVLGRLEKTIVVITADHGEAFGERGAAYHSTGLFDELVRVPLIVRVPGVAGRRIDTPVSLIDVAPTIAEALGLSPSPTWHGAGMMSMMAGASAARPPVISAVEYDDIHRQFALVDDGWKLIWDWKRGHRMLFDLGADPAELDNRVADDPARADAMTARLCAELKANSPLATRPAPPGEPTPLYDAPADPRR